MRPEPCGSVWPRRTGRNRRTGLPLSVAPRKKKRGMDAEIRIPERGVQKGVRGETEGKTGPSRGPRIVDARQLYGPIYPSKPPTELQCGSGLGGGAGGRSELPDPSRAAKLRRGEENRASGVPPAKPNGCCAVMLGVRRCDAHK